MRLNNYHSYSIFEIKFGSICLFLNKRKYLTRIIIDSYYDYNLYKILRLINIMLKIYLVMLFLIIVNYFITIIPITAQLNQTLEQTTDGNITSTIKPQGTSMIEFNESSKFENSSQTTSAGNVTSTIKPQGTSLDNPN